MNQVLRLVTSYGSPLWTGLHSTWPPGWPWPGSNRWFWVGRFGWAMATFLTQS